MFTLFVSLYISMIPTHATERVEYLRVCEGSLASAAGLVRLPQSTAEMRQLLIDFGALRSVEFQGALLKALGDAGLGRETVPTDKKWMKVLKRADESAPALAAATLENLALAAPTTSARDRFVDLKDAIKASPRREAFLDVMTAGVRETLRRAATVHRAKTWDQRIETGIVATFTTVMVGLIPVGLWEFNAFYGQPHFLLKWHRPENAGLFWQLDDAMRTWAGMSLPMIPAAFTASGLRWARECVRPKYRRPADATPSLIEDMTSAPRETLMIAAEKAHEACPVDLVYLGHRELARMAEAVNEVSLRWDMFLAAWTAKKDVIAAGFARSVHVEELRPSVVDLVRTWREKRESLREDIATFRIVRERLLRFAEDRDDDDVGTAKRALVREKIDRDFTSLPVPNHFVGDASRETAFERELLGLARLLSDLELVAPGDARELTERVQIQTDAISRAFYL